MSERKCSSDEFNGAPGPAARMGWLYLATVVLTAFFANWLWEMLQMSAYRDFAGKPWRETIGRCTLASAGDVFLTLLAYVGGAVLWRDRRWGLEGSPKTYLTLAILAFVIACAVEFGGLALGLWSYDDGMPLFPKTRLGLLPLAQLTLLVPLSFWVGNAVRCFVFKRQIRS